MTKDGKRWTVLLMSEEGSGLRQFNVHSRALRLAVGGTGFFGLAFVVFAAMALTDGADSIRNAQLERENTLLTQELQTIRSRVGTLESELGVLARKDAELRVLAGLDAIDEEVLQVGIGGPGSPNLDAHPLVALNRETGEEAFAVAYDLNALERRARLLRESLTEASDSLSAHRDLLQATPSILPTSGTLTSRFSNARLHPIHNLELPHEGIDISAPRGTPIMAAANGRVTFAGRKSGYGLVVEVSHGYGYSTLYGHASELLVRIGQQIERGEVIARVGNTGIATSSHLHYEVRVAGRPVNPLNYVITGAIP